MEVKSSCPPPQCGNIIVLGGDANLASTKTDGHWLIGSFGHFINRYRWRPRQRSKYKSPHVDKTYLLGMEVKSNCPPPLCGNIIVLGGDANLASTKNRWSLAHWLIG